MFRKTLATASLLGLALAGLAHADLSGFANFTANGVAAINGGTLTLTTAGGQVGSGFSNIVQSYAMGFTSKFTFLATNEVGGGADGFTFTLQNDIRNASALGGGGGDKGYSGGSAVTPSVAIVANNFNGSSLSAGSNGSQNSFTGGGGDTTASGVDFGAPTPVNVTVTYNPNLNGGQISFNAVQGAGAYNTTFNTGNLTTILGGTTARVGFSAGTGGGGFQQDVSNFSYTAVPEPATATMLVGGVGMLLGLRRRRA